MIHLALWKEIRLIGSYQRPPAVLVTSLLVSQDSLLTCKLTQPLSRVATVACSYYIMIRRLDSIHVTQETLVFPLSEAPQLMRPWMSIILGYKLLGSTKGESHHGQLSDGLSLASWPVAHGLSLPRVLPVLRGEQRWLGVH